MAKCCDPKAPRPKIIKVGGRSIGVMGLEGIMAEVAEIEGLTLEKAVYELFVRFKKLNYVADSAVDEYMKALQEEYRIYLLEKKMKGRE